MSDETFLTCDHCGLPTLRGTGRVPLVLCLRCGGVLCASCRACSEEPTP